MSDDEDWSSKSKSSGKSRTVHEIPEPADVFKFNSQAKQWTKLGGSVLAIRYQGGHHTISSDHMNVTIGAQFKWTLAEKGGAWYGSFAEKGQNWSIKFASKDTAEGFTVHVSLAIGVAQGDLFTYDLAVGEGEGLQFGDTAGVKMLAFTVTDGGLPDSPYFTSKSLARVALGSQKHLEGLESGLEGMKINGKRIIVIPPHMTRGAVEPTTPQKVTVLFIINLDKVRVGDHSTPKPTPTPKHAKEEDSEEDQKQSAAQKLKALARDAKDTKADRDRERDRERDRDDDRRRSPDRYRDDRDRRRSPDRYRDDRDRDRDRYRDDRDRDRDRYNDRDRHDDYGRGNSGFHGGPGGFGPNSPYPNPANPYGVPGPFGMVPPSPFGAVVPNPLNPLNPLANPYVAPGALVPAGFPNPYAPVPAPVPAPAPTPAPAPPPQNNTLATPEGIQLLVEEKHFKSSIDAKLDTVIAKVEQLSDRVNVAFVNEKDVMVSSGISAQALLQTIQRIVDDNERMHLDVEEKTIQCEKIQTQMNTLLEKTQRTVEQSSRYTDEQNQNFNLLAAQQKKKIDQLIDERENLVIEVANAATEVARAENDLKKMKQKYQTVVDDLTVTREELSQERKTRSAEQEEVESAKQELSNFKTRYREENRKMNEALQDKKHMFQELESEREKVARQQVLLDELKKVQETAITKAESGYMEERNTLNEELAKWKSAYHKLKADATQKMQEFQDQQLEAAAAERAQLRENVKANLDKHVALAVEAALVEASTKESENIQKAITAARVTFQEEKERSMKLQEDDWEVRLQQAVKEATRKGFNDGLIAAKDGKEPEPVIIEKEVQVAAKEVIVEKFIDNPELSGQIDALRHDTHRLKQENETLKSKLASHQRSTQRIIKNTQREGVVFLHTSVRALVNDTFKSLRTAIDGSAQYDGGDVLTIVKDVLVKSTIGSLPEIPDEIEDDGQDGHATEEVHSYTELREEHHEPPPARRAAEKPAPAPVHHEPEPEPEAPRVTQTQRQPEPEPEEDPWSEPEEEPAQHNPLAAAPPKHVETAPAPEPEPVKTPEPEVKKPEPKPEPEKPKKSAAEELWGDGSSDDLDLPDDGPAPLSKPTPTASSGAAKPKGLWDTTDVEDETDDFFASKPAPKPAATPSKPAAVEKTAEDKKAEQKGFDGMFDAPAKGASIFDTDLEGDDDLWG